MKRIPLLESECGVFCVSVAAAANGRVRWMMQGSQSGEEGPGSSPANVSSGEAQPRVLLSHRAVPVPARLDLTPRQSLWKRSQPLFGDREEKTSVHVSFFWTHPCHLLHLFYKTWVMWILYLILSWSDGLEFIKFRWKTGGRQSEMVSWGAGGCLYLCWLWPESSLSEIVKYKWRIYVDKM